MTLIASPFWAKPPPASDGQCQHRKLPYGASEDLDRAQDPSTWWAIRVHRAPLVHQCRPASPGLKHPTPCISSGEWAVGSGHGYDLGAFQRYHKTGVSKTDLGPLAWSKPQPSEVTQTLHLKKENWCFGISTTSVNEKYYVPRSTAKASAHF